MNMVFEDIPVVDLSPLFGPEQEHRRLAQELCEICHRVGFFVAVNHGIERKTVSDVFDMMKRFFALPPESKALIDKRSSRHFRGWEPVGTEFTNNRPDIREQIDIWSEWPTGPIDAEPAYERLHGPNQWLPQEVLPGHREISLRWVAEAGRLADGLLAALAVGLGLERDHLRRFFGDRPMSLAKFIHYPPTPTGAAGVNAHHDAGFLTVLAPGSTPGLQVQNQDGRWIDVPVIEDSFVINLGEMLQGMTGNYLVATPHRVISNEERFSTGYFHGPSLDSPLTPLPLPERIVAAVAASPAHAQAGFMARKHETESGVGDMASDYVPETYGEQLWNYFSRSYPENMATHYGRG